MKICLENPDLVKMGQKYRMLYMKTQICCIVAGDMRSLWERCCRRQNCAERIYCWFHCFTVHF